VDTAGKLYTWGAGEGNSLSILCSTCVPAG
jgi:hypothetical protein